MQGQQWLSSTTNRKIGFSDDLSSIEGRLKNQFQAFTNPTSQKHNNQTASKDFYPVSLYNQSLIPRIQIRKPVMKLIPLLAFFTLVASGSAAAAEMAKVEGGSYRPLYLKKETSIIKVKPFQIDKYPVTNAEFAEFVKKHPQWQKGKVSSKQAEPAYLKHWVKTGSNSYAPKPNELKHPVTNVSWFAANAYCTAQGKRLPTIDQWEFAGLASATQKNGSAEPGYNRTILDWYADGGRNGLHDVGKSKPNYWGIYDMHGLIWEWTEDFNSSLLSSGNADTQMFCSGASVGSSDPSNYAAFLRYGIRTSLQSKYVLHNLGFRCASK